MELLLLFLLFLLQKSWDNPKTVNTRLVIDWVLIGVNTGCIAQPLVSPSQGRPLRAAACLHPTMSAGIGLAPARLLYGWDRSWKRKLGICFLRAYHGATHNWVLHDRYMLYGLQRTWPLQTTWPPTSFICGCTGQMPRKLCVQLSSVHLPSYPDSKWW
jgi:hypothetical protein